MQDVTDERALERARSDFVATASHELRTPLAAVYGSARTLRRTDIELPPDQRDRFLEIIESETERLTAIVSQILLAGQLEDGGVDLATSATDLRGLAESVLDSTRVHAPAEVELKLDPGDDSTVALADEDKLRQVLVNLLDNAVKYSPDGGEVAVELGSAPGLVTLTVRDSGLGIPPGEQDRIFEKFYRLDPALTRGVGGSGLGLYISRELVSRMGGRMSVRSRPGEGAAFTVEAPGRLARVSRQAAHFVATCSYSLSTMTVPYVRRSSARCSCTATRSSSRPTATARSRPWSRGRPTPSSST